MSEAFISRPSLFCDALDEARLHRQLGGAEAQRLACGFLVDAVDLKHDTAGLHPAGPVVDRALAFAHADLGRLGRHRYIREHPDPHPALALHFTRNRAAGRLDLASGDAVRFHRLQSEATEIQIGAALGDTVDAALELLAEPCALWLQHRSLL